MKNLNTTLAIVSVALLLGSALTSGIPFFAWMAGRAIGFVVALALGAWVFAIAGTQFQSATAAWLCAGSATCGALIILGAVL